MSKNYEDLRKKNIEDNKRILAELGLLNPFNPLPKVRRNKIVKKVKEDQRPIEKQKKYVVTDKDSKADDVEGYGSVYESEGRTRSTRSSSRLKGKTIDFSEKIIEQQYQEAEEEMERQREKRRVLGSRPMVYGPIPGVEVGAWWATRMECNHDGVHRPTVAGIHAGPKGPYSIALSGGYEDDIDMGDCFTYTGEGGRDLKGTSSQPKNLRTAPQSKDQELSRGNMALKVATETNFPIRVIRGYKSDSPFAPEEGYRYDGLYKCEKAWFTTGMAGFGVWKFALRRIEDQAPPPWTIDGQEGNETEESDSKQESKDEVIKSEVKAEVKEKRKTDKKAKGRKKETDDKGSDAEVKEEEEEDKLEEDDESVKKEVKEENAECKKEKTNQNESDAVKEEKEESELEKDESAKKETKEEIEVKEENNNEEDIVKSPESKKASKPMKEIQAPEKAKKRKAKPSDSDDFDDDDDDEPTKKKVKKDTKKDKKEKENASMSKGLMGWLVKSP